MATHSLTLGSLLLTDSIADPTDGYVFNVLAEGAGFGVAKGVRDVVVSLLADGDLTRITRYGNREVTFLVEITGPTLGSLAKGEAALRDEIGKGNTLVWQPPDDFAAPSLFKVVTSEMEQKFDDLDEMRTSRTFSVTLTCAPQSFSVSTTTVTALAIGSGTDTMVDTCDSATGWTGFINGSSFGPADPGWLGQTGAVWVYEVFDPGGQTLSLRRTGSFPVSTTPYIFVSVQANEPLITYADAVIDGVTRSLKLISQQKSTVDPNRYDFIFAVPAGSTTVTVLNVYNYSSADTAAFGIAEVRRLPAPATAARQTSRVLDVGGTERTPASLRAYVPSGYLGITLLHTTPYDGSGYTPNMRRWRATGNTTSANTGARKISGTWEPMKPNAVVSRTPAHSLPRGDYLLVAAIRADTATTNTPFPIDWAAKSVISGQIIGEVSGRGYGWFPVPNELTIVPIAALQAPVVRSGALDLEVHLLNPTSTLAMDVEEWWLFRDDEDSALSIVSTSEASLWLDSPDVDSGVPEVWVGPSKPLAYHPTAGLISQGSHTFKPGQVLITSVSDTNDYLKADLTYNEGWHSNAAR